MAVTSPIIEVFADLWCPFTHVGLRAVVEERDRMGRSDVPLRVRAWPLELVNGEPMDFARARDHAADLATQVVPGLFVGLRPEGWPTSTLEALATVEAAYRKSASLGEQVSLGLRDALFEEGRDLSDPEVLAELAEQYGVPATTDADRGAVASSLEEGRSRGVQGSPHFFCGDEESFCPSLEIARKEEHELTVGLRPDALRQFLAGCLA
jgi:predicted DsbA family dithiol-disulfide isomerase